MAKQCIRIAGFPRSRGRRAADLFAGVGHGRLKGFPRELPFVAGELHGNGALAHALAGVLAGLLSAAALMLALILPGAVVGGGGGARALTGTGVFVARAETLAGIQTTADVDLTPRAVLGNFFASPAGRLSSSAFRSSAAGSGTWGSAARGSRLLFRSAPAADRGAGHQAAKGRSRQLVKFSTIQLRTFHGIPLQARTNTELVQAAHSLPLGPSNEQRHYDAGSSAKLYAISQAAFFGVKSARPFCRGFGNFLTGGYR